MQKYVVIKFIFVYLSQIRQYMIYTATNYQKTFHPTKSIRTVQRMIKSGLMPSNHFLIVDCGVMLVNVMTIPEKSEYYLEKAIEFQKRKSKTIQDAVAFCILNSLDLQLFVKIVGV